MLNVKKILEENFTGEFFSFYAFAFFNKKEINCFGNEEMLFDLASLTKPLVMFSLFLKNPELFGPDEHLALLEHRSGMKAHALLNKYSYSSFLERQYQEREQGLEVYSDLGFLYLQQKIESESGLLLEDFYRKNLLPQNLFWWRDLTGEQRLKCAVTGMRNQKKIQGDVHDDNAFNLKKFCCHAGLFSTVKDLARFIQSWSNDKKVQHLLQERDARSNSQRFLLSFERAEKENSLAGEIKGRKVVGHLGFTGTSFWFDIETGEGLVLLTNATQKFIHERTELNRLRRCLGSFVWKECRK